MNRRKFLQTSASTAAVASIARSAVGWVAEQPRRVGLIGCGWYGKIDLFRLIQVSPVEVVSLCDVDSKMLAEAADMVAQRQVSKRRPRTYSDYREMLRQRDLDIVLIATPDHWHALIMIAAAEAGADIYVQKPISIDVAEGQAMLATARQTGRVVQVGMQRRSTPHLIEARNDIVRSGKLGQIGHVEIYCYYHMRNGSNPPSIDPPKNLDFEMWTGPAPMRPFSPVMHPRGWRAFTEYGNGILGDMCVHMLDMVRWMLDLGWPKRISSSGGVFIDKKSIANIPDTQTANFDFGNLTVVWQHRSWGAPADARYPWGATFYGDKGTLKASVMGYDFVPEAAGKSIHRDVTFEREQYPEDTREKDIELHVAPAVRGHMRDFLAAIDSRKRPVSDIEQGHISTASCILANLGLKLGRTLTWDAAQGKIVGDEEANKLLLRPYRAPWVHPTA